MLGAAAALGASIELGWNFLWELVPVTLLALTGLSLGFIWAGITRTPEGANTLDIMAAIPLLFLAGAMWPRTAYPDVLERIVDYAVGDLVCERVAGLHHHAHTLRRQVLPDGLGAGSTARSVTTSPRPAPRLVGTA